MKFFFDKTQWIYNELFEGVIYMFNPKNPSGIVIVDDSVLDILCKCDGKNSFNDIISVYDDYSKKRLKKDIERLYKKQVILLDKHPYTEGQYNTSRYDAWFHITNSCNLECRYCYIDKSQGNMPVELSFEFIDNIVESCRKSKIKRVTIRFAGGEPLLNFDGIKAVVAYCNSFKDIKFSYKMITNGTLFNDVIIQFLENNHFSVGVSLDGPEEFHNTIRTNRWGLKSYSVIVDNIKKLTEHNLPVTILTTVTLENVDCLPQLTDELIKMKVSFRYSFERNLEKKVDLIYKQETLIKSLIECMKLIEERILQGYSGFNFQINNLSFTLKRNRNCSAGENTFAAGFDKYIGLCGMGLLKPIGKYDGQDIYKMIEKKGKFLSQYSVDDNINCIDCTWKYICAGECPLHNYYINGTLNSKSLYCETICKIMPQYLRVKALILLMQNDYFNQKGNENGNSRIK